MSKYIIKNESIDCFDTYEDANSGGINFKFLTPYEKNCNTISHLLLLLKSQNHLLQTLYSRVQEDEQNCLEFAFEFKQVISDLALLENVIKDGNYDGLEREVNKRFISSLEKLKITAKNTQDIDKWFIELNYSASFLGFISIIPTILYLIFAANKASVDLVSISFVAGVALVGAVKLSEEILGYSGEPNSIFETNIQAFNEIDLLLGKVYELPH